MSDLQASVAFADEQTLLSYLTTDFAGSAGDGSPAFLPTLQHLQKFLSLRCLPAAVVEFLAIDSCSGAATVGSEKRSAFRQTGRPEALR